MKPQTIFFILSLIAALSFSMSQAKAQSIKEEIELLKVDTSYAFFQYHSLATAKKFSELLSNSKEKRVVLFHFGASHIQAEIVTSRAKEYLYESFGNAGPGFLFPFSAFQMSTSLSTQKVHFL